MNPADGMPPRQPPDGPAANPARPRRRPARGRPARGRLAAGGTVVAAAAIAVIIALSAHHPAGPGFHAFDPGTGVGGQATLHGTPTGTQISLTLTGLPAGQRCILVTVSRAGAAVAGTWTAECDGTAEITGVTAIPQGRLIALHVDAPPGRLLLNIPL